MASTVTTAVRTVILCMALLFVTLSPALGASARHPPGVHPMLCPTYPNCDTALIAAHLAAQAHGPNYSPEAAGFGHLPGLVPGLMEAPQYPAGVSPQSCPNYPFCH